MRPGRRNDTVANLRVVTVARRERVRHSYPPSTVPMRTHALHKRSPGCVVPITIIKCWTLVNKNKNSTTSCGLEPVWISYRALCAKCRVKARHPFQLGSRTRRAETTRSIYHHGAQWEGAEGQQVNRTKICTLRCGFQRDFGHGFDSGATTTRGLSHSYSYNVLYVHKNIAPISLQCRQHIIEAPRCRTMASRETPNSE